MKNKKAGIIATGALTGALLLSGIGYAYAETADIAAGEGFMGRAGGGLVAIVSELTGLDAGDVAERRMDGESFAAIAEAEGVATDDVKAAAVEEFEAGLDERLTSTEELRGRKGRGGPGGMMGGPASSPAAVLADMSDLTNAEIAEAREGGQSLTQIAEGAGVDIDDVIAEVMAGAQEHLDEAVEDGRIDADQVDEILENMEERLTEMVNSTEAPEAGGRGGHGGPGMGPDTDTE